MRMWFSAVLMSMLSHPAGPDPCSETPARSRLGKWCWTRQRRHRPPTSSYHQQTHGYSHQSQHCSLSITTSARLTMLQTRSRTRPAGTTETRVPAALCFYSQSSSSERLTATSARTHNHEGCRTNCMCDPCWQNEPQWAHFQKLVMFIFIILY